MGMVETLVLIASNLGTNYPDLVLFVLLLGSFLFFAINFRLGVMLAMVCCAGLYVIFHEWNIDPSKPFAMFLILFVVLCLSLFVSMSREQSGVIG